MVTHGTTPPFRLLVEESQPAIDNFISDVNDIVQHGEQKFPHAPDHFSVNKRNPRCVDHFQSNTPGLVDNFQVKIFVAVAQGEDIVGIVAGIGHCQSTAPQQRGINRPALYPAACRFHLKANFRDCPPGVTQASKNSANSKTVLEYEKPPDSAPEEADDGVIPEA
jgi:hypothetical protein